MLLLIDMVLEKVQQLARMIGVQTFNDTPRLAVLLADFAQQCIPSIWYEVVELCVSCAPCCSHQVAQLRRWGKEKTTDCSSVAFAKVGGKVDVI
jgi:hypothetical protein